MLEMSEDIHLNTISMLGKNSVFAISVLTLVEISHRKELVKAFIDFINSIPMLILKPSHQILEIEENNINSDVHINDLILLISNPVVPKTRDEIISFLQSDNFTDICHTLKKDQTEAFKRIQKEIESEKDVICSPEEFVQKRFNLTKGKYYSVDFKDRNFLSQKIINFLLYYTYKIRKKKSERSAPFDFLISSIVPYVDIFITENSQAKSLNMIKVKHGIINNVEILVMKDLREEKYGD